MLGHPRLPFQSINTRNTFKMPVFFVLFLIMASSWFLFLLKVLCWDSFCKKVKSSFIFKFINESICQKIQESCKKSGVGDREVKIEEGDETLEIYDNPIWMLQSPIKKIIGRDNIGTMHKIHRTA